MTDDESRLLICTVGGSPEPIVFTLKEWRPVRVYFVHTRETKEYVETQVIPKVREGGFDLDPGRYELFELPDGQDLEGCLDHLRPLMLVVEAWAKRGASFKAVIDFTGGTKCMSAAIAISASRSSCEFSYVGGSVRTKDGVGVVISGAEKIVRKANPWDALGHQAVEDFIVLVDQHAYLAAASVVEVTKTRVSRPVRKRELAALEQLAKALDAWDRFDHTTSKNLFGSVAKSANDLRAVLGVSRGDRVLVGVDRLAKHLNRLEQSKPPSSQHVIDLLMNAWRRRAEGRFDDAVARLYRAIEAVAQVALKVHGIESTEKVSLERVPRPLQGSWAARANDGAIAIGLQDAYALLDAIGDPVGAAFIRAGLNDKKSPLVARNSSILAHGFERVSEEVFDRLWSSALMLAKVDPSSLPSFPKLCEAIS